MKTSTCHHLSGLLFRPALTLLTALLTPVLAWLTPAHAADAPAPPYHLPTYTFTSLGTLPGFTNSYWEDLNDLGQAVGQSFSSSYDPNTDTSIVHANACLYRDGDLIDLGALIDPNANSNAVTMN